MRRICFDIACSLYRDYTDPFLNEPANARSFFENQDAKFHAATAFDEAEQNYRDFTDPQELFNFLVGADEIITFNGRVYDLILLEMVLGKTVLSELWKIAHHDLWKWRGFGGLHATIQYVFPSLAKSFESEFADRLDTLFALEPSLANHLANTYRDTKFTYLLYREYAASGESSNTFRDVRIEAF